MLSIAAPAFILGLPLPRGAEALAAALAVAASILNGQSFVHTVSAFLPVHYWQSWTSLFGPAEPAEFGSQGHSLDDNYSYSPGQRGRRPGAPAPGSDRLMGVYQVEL
jgi:hypothetical protein